MKRRVFITHKGFKIYLGTSTVTPEDIEAARAELAAAAAPSTSVEEQPAATEQAETETDD